MSLLAHPACDGCGPEPADGDAGPGTVGTCEGDSDCTTGGCVSGVCVDDLAGDGGPDNPQGDAGAGATGELTVQPSLSVEFGAQLIGYAVTQDVILINTGNAPLKIFAVLLDQDGDEFSVTPEGTLGVDLEPDDNMVLQVTHTPQDGTPDFAELKVLHDAPGTGITTVDLFADFKGDAELSATTDQATLEPLVTTIAFGENVPGVPATTRLWVRNTGRQDSVLTISDITITPPTVGFVLAEEPDLPEIIGAWSASLCMDGTTTACPPATDACTAQVCVDADGEPMAALPLDIVFTSAVLPETATLTIEHDTDGAVQQTDIVLTGSPTQPDILVEPAAVDFGVSLVDAPTPVEVVVTVSNIGAGPLLIEQVVEPTEVAFEIAYSRPVPMISGDPALRLDNGATPLDITITFVPTLDEAYTGFLVLYTNDGDELQVNIPIEGVGLICQDNAHVDSTSGLCVCDATFIACGNECKAPSATSCGASCTDCTGVGGFAFGTAASCSVAGACEYSCEGSYYDLDDGADGTPGDNGWNGCEYFCNSEVQLTKEYQCDGVDEDCNGIADDGLAEDAEDTAGSNNTAATAATGTVLDEVPATASPGTTETLSQRSLYPAGDSDWFQVKAIEGNSGIGCANEVPCIDGGQENYTTIFEVVSPNGLDYDIEVWAPSFPNYDDPAGDGQTFTDGNNDDIIGLEWSRASSLLSCVSCWLGGPCFEGGYGCTFNDSQVFFVNIKPQAGQTDTFSCEPYELKVTSFERASGSGN